MGCVSSNPQDDSNSPPTQQPQSAAERAESEKAQKQRRRLSVAPQHVGDITSSTRDNDGSASPRRLNPDDNGLSALELRCKGKIRHASMSKKGVVPYNKNKVNQDRFICKYAVGNDIGVAMFGVMDGHGEFGHLVAQFVSDKLPNYMAQQVAYIRSDPEKYICLATKNLCDELAGANINVAFSGTTCVFGVLVDRTLHVANIGDSRCVVCRQHDNGQIQAIALSEDQKPDNPKEKARILRAGGRVEPLPGPPGEDCGPPRVWLADVDVPGLAMSRSIGDEVSQTVGVISIPEVRTHQVQSNDILAIWASDGVWEFLSNEQVISILWKYRHDLNEAAKQVVDESVRQWNREEEVVDDITCVIIQFNEPK